MRIAIVTSGGFGGLEQRYEIFDASEEAAVVAEQFEGTALTLGIPAALSSSQMPDGTLYEIEIEDEDGIRRYAVDDSAAGNLLAQLDELLAMVPLLPQA
ncbi:hypothetical protein L6R29_01060 [Myxococcota bacterium]|nr:hypothetical protein [Myxococcota bacterium]